jgi:peptidoglycan/xylan/chitin deacetylase (PgdA/CDA1 family)
MIWRDDDILQHSGLAPLLRVDDCLQAAGVVHTIAIVARTLTPALARVIRDRRMSAQLHCWDHDDLAVDAKARAQLAAAVATIEDLIGVRPTTLYPPWNRTSDALQAAAAALGLTVSAEKLSLEQFIRVQGDVPEASVLNFHYWSATDREALTTALTIRAAAA